MFSRKYWENSLVTSENQIVCFPSFVLIVFWCFISYTVKNVPWKMLKVPVNATACWWPCTCLKFVSGLRWLERNLFFFRCTRVFDLLLEFVSDINEGSWSQLLLQLTVLMGAVNSVKRMSFLSYFPVFRLKYSRIALWRKRLQLHSQNDLTTNGLILGCFCSKNISFRWVHIFMA